MVYDFHGQPLLDGDAVIIVKDLKIKGVSEPLQQGTRIKSIHIIDGQHQVEGFIDGIGQVLLKSEFVRKIDL